MLEKLARANQFAFLEKNGKISLFLGAPISFDFTADIHKKAAEFNKDIFFALPYCTIRERGFEALGDEKILALIVEEEIEFERAELLQILPQEILELSQNITPSLTDAEHIEKVKQLQNIEIEGGNASQINFSRIFKGKFKNHSLENLLGLYRVLLEPRGQYMTYLFAHKKASTYHALIGATPECHLKIDENSTVMMPIAGTFRKNEKSIHSIDYRLQQFLTDPKEINELYQVTDEELKMMGRICPEGGYFEGPFLKEIGQVIHTHYTLIGKRTQNPIEALRHTLHAPTVVGSPMESAAKIIKDYEGETRRYYGGEIGIYRYKERAANNEFGSLDTGILIRSAEIFEDGTFRVQAGGGIVRDSDPISEAEETHAKASTILHLLAKDSKPHQFMLHEKLSEQMDPILQHRNRTLSKFWMNDQSDKRENLNLKISIVNNEDDFAFMLGHVLNKLGCAVQIFDTFEFNPERNEADIVVLGPGPGDINDTQNPRMVKLLNDLNILKQKNIKILGVCLGHQALAVSTNIPVVRQKQSTQGLQKIVYVMEGYHRLAFYNSFSPVFDSDAALRKDLSFDLDEDGRIIALYSKNFIGFQFHPESIMSETGKDLLMQALLKLMAA